jgi:hypothetical protein
MNPCGGWVEYFHHYPASHRRRRKGMSQIWDSNTRIWSRVPTDSDSRKTALARPRSIYKKETRPLVRGAPQNNCQTVINIWSWALDRARHQDWLTVILSVTSTLTLNCCCEKLVAEAREQFGNPEEGEPLRLEVATKQRLMKTNRLRIPSVSYSDLWSVWNSESIILACKSSENPITNTKPRL